MELKNKEGLTQLFYFCGMGMKASVARMLKMRNIDVESRDSKYGWTCLHAAAGSGQLDMCRMLLEKGAQMNAKESDGMTPLHYACHRDHIEIVRLWCDRGSNIEAINIKGGTPLYYAALNGHLSVVKELVEKRNAKINVRVNNGATALSLARSNNKVEVATYLRSHGGIE